jgi:chaperonin GroES
MLEPVGDRIIVEVKKDEDANIGGIYVASSAKQKPTEGTVVAVGKGKYSNDGKLIPMTVAKGDKIVYDKYAGTNVEYEGKKYLVLREQDVLAIEK